ncbi:MAG: hypothetical protein LKI03_06265 [Acetobacter indonesiensis]|jgi:hypothetical protein|nr:hypothetical protein [Acetobacter indonesiensis]MCI1546191.1 hypothetical protein [Acetobacter indonesiensis]MCI1765636.1 hypothetical protein [Acetobacter indonesiensis]
MFYTVVKSTSGEIIGAGQYTSEPATLQTGETACDEDTYQAALATVTTLTLAQQASAALSTARTYVGNTYTMLNEATPTEWVAYLKALMAIANGTDTTSTTLPSAPAS